MKFTWLGLRTNREKSIYTEAFWAGVNATDNLKKQMIKQEEGWLIARNTAVREVEAKSTESSDLVGLPR